MMHLAERMRYREWALGALLMLCAQAATAAGKLVVEKPWIRLAPQGAMMLAGYAALRNEGDAPIVIYSAASADFGSVSMHETVEEGGVAKMRPLQRIEIAPGAVESFAPGGKHLMLMKPQRNLNVGDLVKIHIVAQGGADIDAEFVVRDAAP